MLDVQRVESLIAEMRDKAGVAVPTPIAREALCGALAQADPMRAEKLLESLKHDGITPCDRCVRGTMSLLDSALLCALRGRSPPLSSLRFPWHPMYV